MKKIKIYMMLLAVFALLLTSCSKDDEAVNENEKLATLSFTTVLNDMVADKASLKQQLDIPACSDDAPAFVAVVLTGETNVGTVDEPLIVSVNPDPDNFDDDPEEEYFTEESSDLELVPGEYTLEYFAVYNGDPAEEGTEVLWVAPREDGALASFVDTALPFTFDLGAGAKKYVDVEVLCFDDRMVNEYGYLFFDLETSRAIEFCVFGNFCDANGRHFPAAFSVSVWEYSDGTQGDIIHEGVANTMTQNDDGDLSASTVCVALPDTSGEDEYWVEITLLDSEAYDTEERVIRSGVLTDTEVRALFDGENDVDYYHFREGNCDSEDAPQLFDAEEPSEEDADNDGVVDAEDNCPNTENPDQEDADEDGVGDACDDCDDVDPVTDADGDGCEDEVSAPDGDSDGIPDSTDNCPTTPNANQADADEDGVGDACDDCDDVDPVTDVDGDGCEDEVSAPDEDSDGIPDSTDNCPTTPNANQADADEDGVGDACDDCDDVDPVTDEDGDGCEDEVTDPDTDGDGVPDSIDNCPNVNPTNDVDGDGCEGPCSIAAPAEECVVAYLEGETGFVEVPSNDMPLEIFINTMEDGVAAVTVDITEGGSITVTANSGLAYLFSAYEVEVADNPSGEGSSSICVTNPSPGGPLTAEFGDIDASFDNLYVRIKANMCPE